MLINNPRELGALIRQSRLNAGLSQADLAKALGTYQPEISKLEKGNPGARINLLFQIARTLGLNVFIDTNKPTATTHTTSEELDELDEIANTGLKK
jgi:HTH-type transcriptional regulator / antitoxin HipB